MPGWLVRVGRGSERELDARRRAGSNGSRRWRSQRAATAAAESTGGRGGRSRGGRERSERLEGRGKEALERDAEWRLFGKDAERGGRNREPVGEGRQIASLLVF